MNRLPRPKLSRSQAAWTRLAILGLALLNQVLYVLGYETIPIQDSDLADFINLFLIISVATYTSWKNNSVTKVAVYKEDLADKLLDDALKEKEEEIENKHKQESELIEIDMNVDYENEYKNPIAETEAKEFDYINKGDGI